MHTTHMAYIYAYAYTYPSFLEMRVVLVVALACLLTHSPEQPAKAPRRNVPAEHVTRRRGYVAVAGAFVLIKRARSRTRVTHCAYACV